MPPSPSNRPTLLKTQGPFSRKPRKAVVVFMQDIGFNSFASNMLKLSVSEQNEVVC